MTCMFLILLRLTFLFHNLIDFFTAFKGDVVMLSAAKQELRSKLEVSTSAIITV